MTGDGLEAEAVEGEYVVGTFFTALGVQPAIGRLSVRRTISLGGGDPAVAVVSWAHWQARFNRDPAILGRQIALNGVPATGDWRRPARVLRLPVGFTPDIWVPAAMETLIPAAAPTGDR